MYTLVANGYASYKEIRDEYSIEEVLDLYEMCLVQSYNKNVVASTVRRNNNG